MEPQEVDAILRSLTATMEHQRLINDDMRAMFAQQQTHLTRLDTAIERIDLTLARLEITQARIETLLARMLPPGENGREA